MAQLLIRGLDEDVVGRLKERATQHGRSLESEARLILESAAGFTVDEARRIISDWQLRLAGRKFSNSTDLLREDRER